MSDDPWIESNGGPLLLAPAALLTAWEGASPPAGSRVIEARFRWDPDGPATDYDRACDVSGYAGVIPVGSGWALVIGDEPSPARWESAPGGGVVVRWEHAPDAATAEAAVASLLSGGLAELAWSPECALDVVSSPLVMFDSAEEGAEPLGRRLVVELAPGRYVVEQARHAPDPELSLHLVRLRAVASGVA